MHFFHLVAAVAYSQLAAAARADWDTHPTDRADRVHDGEHGVAVSLARYYRAFSFRVTHIELTRGQFDELTRHAHLVGTDEGGGTTYQLSEGGAQAVYVSCEDTGYWLVVAGPTT